MICGVFSAIDKAFRREYTFFIQKKLEGLVLASILRHRDTDMTEGNIARLLINFALPLLIGNIFQQLYTVVDASVVGRGV